MSFALECGKVKRTGFLPAFFGGGFLAGAVPALNMLFRSEMYTGINDSPVSILLRANWQMISMLNILLVIVGACILYNIEYADNAIQRMRALPVSECAVFFGKTAVLAMVSVLLLAIEAVSIGGCAVYWFESDAGLYGEMLKNFSFFLLLMLPSVLASLLTASLCRNMWISLGIGVVCVFAATMIPARNFVLSLFPFAMPFQILADHTEDAVRNYRIAGAAETAGIALLEVVILKIRRLFE